MRLLIHQALDLARIQIHPCHQTFYRVEVSALFIPAIVRDGPHRTMEFFAFHAAVPGAPSIYPRTRLRSVMPRFATAARQPGSVRTTCSAIVKSSSMSGG